jgi:hypothetical protein
MIITQRGPYRPHQVIFPGLGFLSGAYRLLFGWEKSFYIYHTIREQKEEEEYRFFRLVETGIPEVTTPSSDCFDPVVVGRRICCCWFLMFWRIDFEIQIRVSSTMCCLLFQKKKGKSKELLLLM